MSSGIVQEFPAMKKISRDKAAQAASLVADLFGAHALVTWSSAAAVTAVMSGVTAVCAPQCAAAPVSSLVAEIDDPPRPERQEWCNVLADNQFTVAEMGDGTAWRMLND